MKRSAALLILLALLLCCAGCAPAAPEAPGASASVSVSAEPVVEKAWRYEVQTETYLDEYKTTDGTLLATGRYEYPVLRLLDDGGNPYDGNGAPPTDDQLAACEAFNALFPEQSCADSFAALTEMAIADFKSNSSFLSLEEQQNVVGIWQTETALCVECESYTFTGGAHGMAWRSAVLFDLARGDAVDWLELTDNPEALERRLSGEVIAVIQREGMEEALFPDYIKAARNVSGAATVFFNEEGAYITYSEYSIGPYAAGMPGFSVAYEKFDDLLNDYGRALLGRP